MTESDLRKVVEDWVAWGGLCVQRAKEHMHNSRIFSHGEVIALLKLKQADPWNIELGGKMFDLWQGKQSQNYKWSGPEFAVMEALYLYACGPLPVDNYELGSPQWGKQWPTSNFRQHLAFANDLIGHVNGLVSSLTNGVGGHVGHVVQIREDFESLFPGDLGEGQVDGSEDAVEEGDETAESEELL